MLSGLSHLWSASRCARAMLGAWVARALQPHTCTWTHAWTVLPEAGWTLVPTQYQRKPLLVCFKLNLYISSKSSGS